MKVKFSMEESENLELSGKSKELNKLVTQNSLEFLLHAQAGVGEHKKEFSEECEQIVKK